MAPIIGTIVHYYPAEHGEDAPPLAAIVTKVWSDDEVDLAIFAEDGQVHPKPSARIPFVDEAPDDGPYCMAGTTSPTRPEPGPPDKPVGKPGSKPVPKPPSKPKPPMAPAFEPSKEEGPYR